MGEKIAIPNGFSISVADSVAVARLPSLVTRFSQFFAVFHTVIKCNRTFMKQNN